MTLNEFLPIHIILTSTKITPIKIVPKLLTKGSQIDKMIVPKKGFVYFNTKGV